MNDSPERSSASLPFPAIEAVIAANLASVLLPPQRVGLPSSWWGHVPFAHWLVAELKPNLVVELGTQHGISFSAFCNAVKYHQLPTRCYGVDTWKGDSQTGFYDESVFNDISAFVQQNYSAFATLLRCQFDEALGVFADGSIDLLHIDGLHTYDAVKADFDAWLPKLSDRGVVLFHDTAIYQRDFGVWRFWKEISQIHPSFEFQNSCGLGVLAPARAIPSFISALIDMNPAEASILRQRLADLGERWISVDESRRAETENTKLQHALLQQSEASETMRENLAAARQTEATLLEKAGAQQKQHDGLAMQCDMLRQHSAAVARQVDALRLQLEQLRTSTSWRVTGPYRIAGRLLKRHLLAAPLQRQQFRDSKQIARSKLFNAAFYLGRETVATDDDVIMRYLASSRAGVPRGLQHPGPPQRRPMLGFHPLIYAADCKEYDETANEDPLAHYLRTGMPDGSWKHGVIQARRPTAPTKNQQRILIHAHFHYPDLLQDFLNRLHSNLSSADLLITTTSEAKAADIRQILGSESNNAKIVVVPNRGRDLGPLLMHFAEVERYDIVGHLHGKRSPTQSFAEGENWREFIWTHLIGGELPTMDVIAKAFAADSRLGLIFPEDPNLNHWDMNHDLSRELAERLNLKHPLPSHFEFPKGNMFWARPAALRPLVDLGWSWDDFPIEPAASDGTVLHTLERMIPFSAQHAGFSFSAIHVPNCWRMPIPL